MKHKSLLDIFDSHDGYISDKWQQYLGVYESELRAIVETDRPVRLLEIGVLNGGSLQIWCKYLPIGSSIVGIDIDERCATLDFEKPIQIFIGDAAEKSFLDAALGDASFDIIVDDGSHESADIVASFNTLFPRLNLGGKYFIEDLHASYWQSHGGGFRNPDSAIEYLKSLIDAVHLDHIEAGTRAGTYDEETYRSMNGQIARISFYDSIAVVEKYKHLKGGRFKRVLTGKGFEVSGPSYLNALIISEPTAMVFSGNSAQDVVAELAVDSARLRGEVERVRSELDQRTTEYRASIDTLRAELAQRMTEHQKTVERLQSELTQRTVEYRAIMERLQAELTDRVTDCERLRQQNDSLQGSVCWRITWPIRWLHKQANRARAALPKVHLH